MRLNQRSIDELMTAMAVVEKALAEKPTKATVVKSLANIGWCSPKSAGIEKTFLDALTAKGITITPNFAAVMGMKSGATAETVKPVTTKEPPTVPATATAPTAKPEESIRVAPPEGPGDFTVVNLKAVSLMQTKRERTEVRFIGSECGLSGSVAVGLLRSSCNLIEFAI